MSSAQPLVVLLNGPLGIGKSTLGEVLGEAIERSVTLDGDKLSALNPSPANELEDLHDVIAILVRHRLAQGYNRFIVNHYWATAGEIADLEARLRTIDPDINLRCFRLTLSPEENLKRIALRQSTRALNEAEFEARTFAEEFALLSAATDELGTRFDASEPPRALATRMIGLLELEF